MLAIDVDRVGRIAFPPLPVQIERLVTIAEAAAYGRGEETLLDPKVRKSWQIGLTEFESTGVAGNRRCPISHRRGRRAWRERAGRRRFLQASSL